MGKRFLAIHGHFYQPPRENPWLLRVKLEPSAAPYHDWNERITRECYAPNTAARLLNDQGAVAKLVNNYAHISFNFGPTLLAWLQAKAPAVYREIIRADQLSREIYGGQGAALAQVYNHLIMPLAKRPDKLLQIKWGLADFAARYGRPAQGMWLAETAVDSQTLFCLAECGVGFTILAPGQCAAVRPLAGGAWQKTGEDNLDTTRPYRVILPEGREITVFFYHGGLSRGIAYERLLASGAGFLGAVERSYPAGGTEAPLLSLATDGESYGHHFKFGDMALAWLIDRLAGREDLSLTNYSAYLQTHPPQYEARIVENSSWSCAHGIKRWREHCGCSASQNPNWSQAWRKPLRQGLDRLKTSLDRLFQQQAPALLHDPQGALDDLWRLAFPQDPGAENRFLERWAHPGLDGAGRERALALLHSQLMAAFMFTSCGWFFDDISGLEPRQILMYAARAMDLAGFLGASGLEKKLMAHLAKAKGNLPQWGNGDRVYRERVATARMSPPQIAAHQALACLGAGGAAAPVAPPVLDCRAGPAGPGPNAPLVAAVSVHDFGPGRLAHYCVLAGWQAPGQPALVTALFGQAANPALEARELSECHHNPDWQAWQTLFRKRHGQTEVFAPADLPPEAAWDFARALAQGQAGPGGQGLNAILRLAAEDAALPPLEDQVLAALLAQAFANGAQGPDFAALAKLCQQRRAALGPAAGFLMKQSAEAWLTRSLASLTDSPDEGSLAALAEGAKLIKAAIAKADLWSAENLVFQLNGQKDFQARLNRRQQALWRELTAALGLAFG